MNMNMTMNMNMNMRAACMWCVEGHEAESHLVHPFPDGSVARSLAGSFCAMCLHCDPTCSLMTPCEPKAKRATTRDASERGGANLLANRSSVRRDRPFRREDHERATQRLSVLGDLCGNEAAVVHRAPSSLGAVQLPECRCRGRVPNERRNATIHHSRECRSPSRSARVAASPLRFDTVAPHLSPYSGAAL